MKTSEFVSTFSSLFYFPSQIIKFHKCSSVNICDEMSLFGQLTFRLLKTQFFFTNCKIYNHITEGEWKLKYFLKEKIDIDFLLLKCVVDWSKKSRPLLYFTTVFFFFRQLSAQSPSEKEKKKLIEKKWSSGHFWPLVVMPVGMVVSMRWKVAFILSDIYYSEFSRTLSKRYIYEKLDNSDSEHSESVPMLLFRSLYSNL